MRFSFFFSVFCFKSFTICRFSHKLQSMVVSLYLIDFLYFYGSSNPHKFKSIVILCLVVCFFVLGIPFFKSKGFKIYKNFKESTFQIWKICSYILIDQLQFQPQRSNQRKEIKRKQQKNIFQKSFITKSVFFLSL